jgi:DNA polymerase-3 subunit delta
MYKKEFDKYFDSNKIFNAYIFYGANDFLVEEYSVKVANKLASGDDITKVYFEDYTFDYCYDFLTQSSLFSASNILLIKTTKKIPKKEVDKLIDACRVNASSSVVFCCMGEVDFKTMGKSFTTKTLSAEVRFFDLYDNEAIIILQEKSTALGMRIDNNSLAFLYNMHQKNISLCLSDLSKLAILEEEITAKTINNHCFGLGSVDIESFINKLFSGANISKDLYFLLEEGMNEVQLLNRLTSFTQHLFMINSYLKVNGSLDIKEIWGYPLPRQIAEQQANIATKFKKADFTYMLNFLLDLELEIKTQKIPDLNAYIQAKLRIFIK